MKIFLAAASVALLASTAAYAADDSKMKSSGDAPAASGQPSGQGGDSQKMSPGTTGAMEKSKGGVATTPGEVQQQGGMATSPKSTDDKAATGAGEKKQ